MMHPAIVGVGAILGGSLAAIIPTVAGPPADRVTAIYQQAATTAGCGDHALLARDLAAIQNVESPGAVLDGDRAVNPDGTSIRGDLDLGYSRGPFQFNDAAGGWAIYGAGGDPDRLDHAAAATARMLCANGWQAGRRAAIKAHNGSGPAAEAYADRVLAADVAAGPTTAGPVSRDGLFLRTMDNTFGWAIDGLRRLSGSRSTPSAMPTSTPRADGLEPQFGANLDRLIAEADGRFGDSAIVVYSGRRTPAEQLALWDESDRTGTWVAWSDGTSCTSEHCRGAAADLAFVSPAVERWAHDNASKHGLQFRMDWEPWHISNKETS